MTVKRSWLRRIVVTSATSAVILAGFTVPAPVVGAGSGTNEYVVLYAERASVSSARSAISKAGGTIVRENLAIGMAKVFSKNARFMQDVRASRAIKGAARNHSVGTVREGMPHRYAVEHLADEPQDYRTGDTTPPPGSGAVKEGKKKSGTEPLSELQWDMKMIHATPDGSYATQKGDPRVLVGVIDTGIDASHPDLPNVDQGLSVNFTTDIPSIDGPCEYTNCHDPATVDHDGHGTHVSGTIAAAINGLGISGVAPGVTLVNIRAGQDSGYFFLEETVNALTYAGDHGVDVVNMSFFTDPWLFNCPSASDSDPAPSAEQAAEQATILSAVNEAAEYAHAHGVTMVAAAGNEHNNLDADTFVDTISPDYPPGTEITRTVTDDCKVVPTQSPHVISVSALGPTAMKADYSNWGAEEIEVSAPGGWFRDQFGTPDFRTTGNLILSAYPEYVGKQNGDITNGGGVPNDQGQKDFVIRDCAQGTCAYYQYLQGTSMASPHAVGVAALIVSEFGSSDGHGGLTMDPDEVRARLLETATDHACPVPATIDYTTVGRPASWNATCSGTADFNNVWGEGIVNALAAVS